MEHINNISDSLVIVFILNEQSKLHNSVVNEKIQLNTYLIISKILESIFEGNVRPDFSAVRFLEMDRYSSCDF